MITDRLAADGFELLGDRCDPRLTTDVLDLSRGQLDRARRALGAKEIGIGSVAGYDEIVQRSPGRWDVPIAPEHYGFADAEMPWWPLVEAALGADAERAYSGVISSDPDSPAQYWHADSPHQAAEHLPPHAINVLVALHDVPLTMGPTECARGSHVLTNHLANPSLVVEELIYQHEGTSPQSLVEGTGQAAPDGCATPLSAGACLVFDDRVLHRGLANRSDQTRHVAYFTYRRRGYTENTYFESQRSVHDQRG